MNEYDKKNKRRERINDIGCAEYGIVAWNLGFLGIFVDTLHEKAITEYTKLDKELSGLVFTN